MVAHSTLTADELHAPYHYNSSSDPGAVGADKLWLDTDVGWLYRRNAGNTGWKLINDGSFFDPVWFGAVGDGTTDDTTAIQAAVAAAKAAGGSRESKVLFRGLKTYLISDTILLPSGAWIEAESFSGAQGPYIEMASTADITKHAFAMETTDRSRACFRNLRLVDNRTSASRTGNGIHINDVTNGSFVENCFVANFYDDIFIGGESAGQEADCVVVRDCWLIHPVHAGLRITRLNNRARVENIMCDTWSNTPVAAILIEGTSGSSGVAIDTVKHENKVDGVHGVWITVGGEHSVSNYTMRGTTNNPASDVIHVTGATAALTLTLRGINAANTTASYGDAVTSCGNLLNIASGSVGTYTIPVAERSIGLYVSSYQGSPPGVGGLWIGNTWHGSGTGSPESVVAKPPGSTFHRTDGGATTSFYVKTSGTGNTGWTAK